MSIELNDLYALATEPGYNPTNRSAATATIAPRGLLTYHQPKDVVVVKSVDLQGPQQLLVIVHGADCTGILVNVLEGINEIAGAKGPVNLERVTAERIEDPHGQYPSLHQCTIQMRHDDPSVIDDLYTRLEKARDLVRGKVILRPKVYDLNLVTEDTPLLLQQLGAVLARYDANMTRLSGSTYPSVAAGKRKSSSRALAILRIRVEVSEDRVEDVNRIEGDIRRECTIKSRWKVMLTVSECQATSDSDLPSLGMLLSDLNRAYKN